MNQKPANAREYQLKHKYLVIHLFLTPDFHNLQNEGHVKLSDDKLICKESIDSGERHFLRLRLQRGSDTRQYTREAEGQSQGAMCHDDIVIMNRVNSDWPRVEIRLTH